MTGVLAAWTAVVPAAVLAQASISGTVRDPSGAVLPTVAIEASSDVLIEQTRTVTTDTAGHYDILDLRPGTYTLTFTLNGFRTVVREGVDVTGSAVAIVNVELPVGPVVDAVTVTSEGGSVDVHSTTRATSISANTVSSIPTGRSLANLAVLIPGITTVSARNQNDVGGINNLQNIFVAIHGGRVTDQRVYVDGVSIRNLQSEGHATNFTPDMSSTSEVTLEYAAVGAEEASGGVRASYIPREGGNRFQLSAYASAVNGAFQGTNITPAMRALRLQADELKLAYDVNPTLGGPIVRNRAWFYAALRVQTNQNYVGGIFENRNAGNPSAWTYDPDTSRPGLFAITQQSVNARFTWQPRANGKLGVFAEKQWRTWDEGTLNRSPEAFSRFRFPANQIAVVSWTSPFSPRLLVDARGSYHAEAWRNIGADELLPDNRSIVPVLEQGGAYPGLMYRAKNGPYSAQSAPLIWVANSSLSSVNRGHLTKIGFELISGTNTNTNTFNDSGLQYRFNDSTPNQITEFATPYALVWRMTELGAFVQDRWTMDRLTLNTGVRFDRFTTSFPEQHLGPGTLLPNRNITFPATSWYRLDDVSPRFGAAIDLTGHGTTVARAAAGRYLVELSPATGNPVAGVPLSVTRRWDDSDGDYAPDCDLLNPYANRECGMISDLNFGGSASSVSYDRAILRGWNVRPADWEFSGGVQHQFARGVDAGATYVRRTYTNASVTDNLATGPADYTAFSVRAPTDPRLPGGGGYSVGGMYDLNPDRRGQVVNFVTAAGRYGRWIEHWNGADVNVTVRIVNATIQGGVSGGRTSFDVCDIVTQLPELLGTASPALGGPSISSSRDQCHVDARFLTQTKWMGTYEVPMIHLRLAGTFQSTPGPELQANYLAPNALVEPSLGRPLSGGANTTVALLPPGQMYGDRLNQLDLRVTRPFRIGPARAMLNVDVYNVFNANPVTAMNLNYTGDGSRWLQPQSVLPARLFRIGAQIEY